MLDEIKRIVDELYRAGDDPNVTEGQYVNLCQIEIAHLKSILDAVPDDADIALSHEERQALAEAFAMGIRRAKQEQRCDEV